MYLHLYCPKSTYNMDAFGKSRQSEPAPSGIKDILNSTNALIFLHTWSFNWSNLLFSLMILWKWVSGSVAYCITIFWSPFRIGGRSPMQSSTVTVLQIKWKSCLKVHIWLKVYIFKTSVIIQTLFWHVLPVRSRCNIRLAPSAIGSKPIFAIVRFDINR